MQLFSVLALAIALCSCAAQKPVRVVWPDPAETAAWQWSYHVEEMEGCRRSEAGIDFRCEAHHGAKL